MENFVKAGKDVDSLLSALDEITHLTSLDSVVMPHDSLKITLKNGNWRIETESDEDPAYLNHGKTFSSLKKCLEKRDAVMDFSPDLCVLALLEMEESRTYDGKFQTKWAKISPLEPYDLIDGVPTFEIMDVDLYADELSPFQESGLAFFDEIDYVFYPIKECAFSSIGKFMDCEASFKSKSKYPLASAMLIAERLADMKDLRILYRTNSGKVKPVVAVLSPKYDQFNQYDFIVSLLNKLPKYLDYPTEVVDWKVNDIRTLIDIQVNMTGYKYTPILRIQTGDVPGTGLASFACAYLDGGLIEITSNSCYHTRAHSTKTYIDALLTGISDAFEEFNNKLSTLTHYSLSYPSQWIDPILTSIGKKNSDSIKGELNKIHINDTDNSYEMLKKICSLTSSFPLHESEDHKRSKAYAEFVDSLYHECKNIALEKKRRKPRERTKTKVNSLVECQDESAQSMCS